MNYLDATFWPLGIVSKRSRGKERDHGIHKFVFSCQRCKSISNRTCENKSLFGFSRYNFQTPVDHAPLSFPCTELGML